MWAIKHEPEATNPFDYDGVIWIAELENEQGETRPIRTKISGSANSTAEEYLPRRVAEFRATQGRSEIEEVLWWAEPPKAIEADSRGIDYELDIDPELITA